MKIDKYSEDILKKLVSDDETLEFSENINGEDIEKCLEYVLSYEEKEENLEKCTKISTKNLSSEQLTAMYKFWMRKGNLERLRNSTVILNIILLLKTYNTFDKDFFEHPLIFISSIDKYLDVKLDLQKEIQEINCRIGVYFMSLVKSLSKTEYTMLDSYVEMPYFFKSVFVSMDLVTISGIISTIPEDYHYKTGFIRDANTYMSVIARNYVMSDDMISEFMNNVSKNGE